MRLADAAIRDIADRLVFRASAAPYLLLDTEFRIRAVNPSYERATLQVASQLLGAPMFEVFPDNPAVPEARGVQRLGESFERALVSGAADRMALQRYDVRDPGTGGFVHKSWLPRNSPLRDPDGRTVGVLHHVEDVTQLLGTTTLEGLLVTRPQRADRDSAARRVRARQLVDQSRAALARMSRRIQDSERT
ncbi:MAG: PAS domain-containing protein, partial [Marmoricola sp.]|nr:PAS domain-containing protein [Marmoricola sp.]